jgi:hypothetical protein
MNGSIMNSSCIQPCSCTPTLRMSSSAEVGKIDKAPCLDPSAKFSEPAAYVMQHPLLHTPGLWHVHGLVDNMELFSVSVWYYSM